MKLILSAFITFIFVFPMHLIGMAVRGRKSRQEKAKEIAIARGHVVTAYLQKSTRPIKSSYGYHPGWVKLGFYTYEYNNKKYKFRYRTEDLPQELTLYFVKDPRKATIPSLLTDSTFKWPWVYVIVFLVFYSFLKSASI